MILYPVALFQQKIVITNKILHLSPKLCFGISFIHFKSLIHLKEYLLSSAMRHSAFLHNLYNLIQFNTDL